MKSNDSVTQSACGDQYRKIIRLFQFPVKNCIFEGMKPITSLVTACLLLAYAGCSHRVMKHTDQTRKVQADKKLYYNEISGFERSTGLGAITAAIHKLYRVTSYTTYLFTPDVHANAEMIRTGRFKRAAIGTISAQESVSGTATAIYCGDFNIALLTCAHILSSPDTLISYFPLSADNPEGEIKSISLRTKEEFYIKELTDCGPFSVLAMDSEKDIAIIGKHCEVEKNPAVFDYPMGRSGELGWGDLVYILGYSQAGLMMTRALVSKPAGADNENFMVDALVNKGFSGGVILAIRNGEPRYETVGLIKSVATRRDYVLRPKNSIDHYYSEKIPYTDETYVATQESFSYGINFVVTTADLITFYKQNREQLLQQGYNLDGFFRFDN